MTFKATTRENWKLRGLKLPYFDGRCEAETLKYTAKHRQDFRCRNNAVAVNAGYAVCWRHRDCKHLFVDPASHAFREKRKG